MYSFDPGSLYTLDDPHFERFRLLLIDKVRVKDKTYV
jgi:hypothetical protein